eukprot:CAMPEP_0197030396 /NCGR_PEP_ID=MMETSP1384-20130603/9637_1 /TAXON_ID=29189 /ORGANISM="Ammonia sp." /LENGTH=382 /DNA_ID=CAMNT_0042459731 /DNA_START=29 /DNA_END=1177 /DNA_ORIENTATION=+
MSAPPQTTSLCVPSTKTKRKGSFTMIFMDFDDTLCSSRLYRLFSNDLSIDLFRLLERTEMRRLQNLIIRSMEHMKGELHDSEKSESEQPNLIRFAVVSNASDKWLKAMLKGSPEEKIPPRLPILDAYFEANGIHVVSAAAEAFKFLKHKFDENAEEIFNHTMKRDENGATTSRWMWKYTTFANIVSSYKQTLNRKCRRIISIGDGNDEERAASHYAQVHRCETLHIRLLRGSTVPQLYKQWKYIGQQLYGEFNALITDNEINLNLVHKVEPRFFVHALTKFDRFECDNNTQCTGNTHQIPAIRAYFQLWMDTVALVVSKEEKEAAMRIVCKSIHRRMFRLEPESATSQNFKLILLKAICKNKQFNAVFEEYYQNVQRRAAVQ